MYLKAASKSFKTSRAAIRNVSKPSSANIVSRRSSRCARSAMPCAWPSTSIANRSRQAKSRT